MKTTIEQLREDIIRKRQLLDAKVQQLDHEWIIPILEAELGMYEDLNKRYEDLNKQFSVKLSPFDPKISVISTIKTTFFWVFVFACMVLLWQVFKR